MIKTPDPFEFPQAGFVIRAVFGLDARVTGPCKLSGRHFPHQQPQALGHHLGSLEVVRCREFIHFLKQAPLDADGHDHRSPADLWPTEAAPDLAPLLALRRREWP